MKISKVEFENFRNFRDRCRIDFPTDGRVTIIYGPNGVGKTTLHQLFQWIFYGEVHFNKTASNKMYNLDYEQSIGFKKKFSVVGVVDFEHPNKYGVIEYYSLRREWIYQKEQYDSKVIDRKFRLSKLIGDDWKTVSDDPDLLVEKFLPSGLSQYFFFDGESMIADLNQKGRDSAKALRKALYSIFDLDIYEQAVVHIGTQSSGTSTVLGKLYLSRAENSTNADIVIARGNYNQELKKVEQLEKRVNDCKDAIARNKAEAQDLSEKIGSNPSQEQLEKRRKSARDAIKTIENAIQREMKSFGTTVMANYPNLMISRVVEEAQYRIGLKIEDEKLLPGLRKELVISLLGESTCLCGNPIHDKERAALESLLKMFPPLSYKYIYDQFKNNAARWAAAYDSDILLKHLNAIFGYRDQIETLHKQIHDIDEEQKQGENVDTLIAQRAKVEEAQRFWQGELSKANKDLGLHEQLKKQRKKKLDELMAANNSNKDIDLQIQVMEGVRLYFESALKSSAKHYSDTLRCAIQDLLGMMLTSTRQVSMTEKFELSVKDSFGDEAKSEGQFAVVSFAYIGGIFKLLEAIPALRGKGYPLILDGPFSKLDVIQRQNVINTIPDYAPQVILFSKDDITDCFAEEKLGGVWTIYSNAERNVSYVEEGYNPEVFRLDGTEV